MKLQKLEKVAWLKEFLKKIKVKPVFFLHLSFASFLSLLAAVFEGLSIGLLIPAIKGIIEMDFNFLKDMPSFRTIIDRVPAILSFSNKSIFMLFATIIFAAAMIKNILQYAANLFVFYDTAKFTSNMRKIIFNRYLSFGKLFFDRSSTGHLDTILSDFTGSISATIINIHRMLSFFFLLIIYLSIMVLISWKLTIFALIVFPVMYYSLKWIIEKIKETSGYLVNSQMELSRKIFNTLSCIPLIKAYVGEEQEKRHFADLSDSVAGLQFSISKKQGLVSPLQEIIVLTALLLLISATAFLVTRGRGGGIPAFLVFFFLIRRSMDTFGIINKTRIALARANAPIDQILRILDDKDKFFIAEGKREFKGLNGNIEFNRLNFSYIREVPVLKDVTFSIEKDKITAIVGPTGAGKTTLINLILRFYECPSSSIIIDGKDIKDFSLNSLRAHMALVTQDILLFDDKIRTNVAYGLDGSVSEEKLIDAVRKARLYDFVMSLPAGLETYIGDRGVKLSGGEKQRVSIARALLKGSEILILDEATSSLDTRTERLIQEAIDEAIKGRTTIVIAHRLSTIKNADKIVVIENGRLIEQGSLKELLDKRGKFYEYWEEQKFY